MTKKKKIILIVLIGLLLGIAGISAFILTDDGSIRLDTARLLPGGADRITGTNQTQPHTPVQDPAMPRPPHKEQASSTSPNSGDMPDTGPFPEGLVKLLRIDLNKLVAERGRFRNTVVHVEWMDHLNDVLKDLDPDKKEAIIRNHTTVLYIKEMLDTAYLGGEIDNQAFQKALGDLMKWHQQSYQAILSDAEYEAVFEVTPAETDQYIDEMTSGVTEYGFILNREIPPEEVSKQVQTYKLDEINARFKEMILKRDEIGKKINAGEMTLEQAREALAKSQQDFIARCKSVLTEKEIETIFGSVENLESGIQTEPPPDLGRSAEDELGFEIENPETTIDMVKGKVDPETMENIKFFYQQRKDERDELITKMEEGKITSDDLEEMSSEMDAEYRENCRNVLKDEEFQLLFSN